MTVKQGRILSAKSKTPEEPGSSIHGVYKGEKHVWNRGKDQKSIAHLSPYKALHC